MRYIRQTHVISKNERVTAPYQYLCVDTESVEEDIPFCDTKKCLRFRLGVCCVVKNVGQKNETVDWHHFNSVDEFWTIVESIGNKSRSTWIFAHNAGFDLTMLDFWNRCEIGKIDCTSAILADPPTIVNFRLSKKRYRVVDTLNYWRCSLNKLGRSCGLPKGKFPGFDATSEAMFRYCERDVDIIRFAVDKLIKLWTKNKLGFFAATSSGLAFNAYRHSFLEGPIVIHTHKPAIALERQSYRGGYSDVFRLGKINQPVFKIDVNGLYPYVMQYYQVPYLICEHKVVNNLPSKEMLANPNEYIANVTIDDHFQPYPVLHEKRLCYAIGNYTTVLAGAELSRALLSNSVRTVHEYSRYKLDNRFSQFVRFFWHLRTEYAEKNQTVWADLCKSFLVSLFGKFGQRITLYTNEDKGVVEKFFGEWIVYQDWSHTVDIYRATSGRLQKCSRLDEWIHAFPAICAYITALGREYMREIRQICGRENVYAQSIDCLIVNTIAMDNLSRQGLLDQTELGKLKTVDSSDGCEIFGINNYRVGERWTLSGIKADATPKPGSLYEVLEFQRLSRILKNLDKSTVETEVRTISMQKALPKGKPDELGIYGPICLPIRTEKKK